MLSMAWPCSCEAYSYGASLPRLDAPLAVILAAHAQPKSRLCPDSAQA